MFESVPLQRPSRQDIRSIAYSALILLTLFLVFSQMALRLLVGQWYLALGVWIAGAIAVKILIEEYNNDG